MSVFKQTTRARAFQFVAVLNGLSVLFVIALYAYGGFYSRYLADDYCHAVYLAQTDNIFEAVRQAYSVWLGRFSVLFFVQLVEWGGVWGFHLMSGVTLLLWLLSLTWLLAELGNMIGLRVGRIVHLWVAGLAIFLSLYQAPALYQVLYWRAGLPYTLPLPFFITHAAFMFWYVRQPYLRVRAIWAGLLCGMWVFFASGLGETTAALEIGLLVIACLITWLTRQGHQRGDVLAILVVSLIGAIWAIILIALAPGTSTRMDVLQALPPIYNPLELSADVIVNTWLFLWDTVQVAPIPNLIAVLASFGIIYFESSNNELGRVSKVPTTRLWWVAGSILVCMFLVIGCSFAPSAFLRFFPVARARFAAHFVLTFCLLLEGGILGSLFSRIQIARYRQLVTSGVILLLGLLALYPLYVSSKVFTDTQEYRQFAEAWDIRDIEIKQAVEAGKVRLTVKQLDAIGDVGEYKRDREFWINLCAAEYYGLKAIRAR